MAEQTPSRQFNNPLFREIHKNTWLKKVPNNESKKVSRFIMNTFLIHHLKTLSREKNECG